MSSSPSQLQEDASAEPEAATLDYAEPARGVPTTIEGWLRTYFLTIFKNVVGWLFILASPVLGVLLPGPGGIPLFIVGFAMVTFPGKRKLTSHVFRGRRLPIESAFFTGLITFTSVVVTGTLMILTWRYYEQIVAWLPADWGLESLGQMLLLGLLALPVTILTLWIALKVVNGFLPWVPKIRRILRGQLRKWGVRLLPTRRQRSGDTTAFVQDEIIGLDEPQRRRLHRTWRSLVPWLKRLALVSFVVGVVFLVVEPVIREWPDVERLIGRFEIRPLIVGVTLYGLALLMFRATAWRHILSVWGHQLPARASIRIWSLGYLARYIPGHTYEILRMALTRQYGPTGVQVNSAQRLETTLVGVAGCAVALAAVLGTAAQRLPQWDALWLSLGLLLALGVFVGVPVLFYKVVPEGGAINRRGDRQARRTRVSRGTLVVLIGWLVLATMVQGYAAILIVSQPLGGTTADLAIMGAFAAALAAAHFAPWAPGGIGVRELVFVGIVSLLIPPGIKEIVQSTPIESFDPLQPRSWQSVWWALLFFLSLVLRLSTTTAEFLLAMASVAVDWKQMVEIARGTAPRRGRRDADPMTIRSSDS